MPSKPKLPRCLLWDDKKSEKDFLNDPFEKIICILLKETSKNEHMLSFPHVEILNEAFYQCTRIVYENESTPDIETLELDIKANTGLKYYSKWVLKMMYAIFSTRKNNSKEVIDFMESFDVFNFMMIDSKVYLNYIKKVDNNKNKQFVDLSPKPCPVDKLKTYPVSWNEITCNYSASKIRAVLNLWSDPLDKIWVLDLIEQERKYYDYLPDKNKKIKDQNIKEIRRDISKDLMCYCAEPLGPIADDDKIKSDYVDEISRLQELTQRLQTKVVQQDSELNRQKNEKQQERSFTLSMILDYSLNHATQDNGIGIINMLNRFLRDLGNSTEEERRLVDEYENQILHPNCFGGNTFNNAKVTMYDPRFDGPMYDVTGNGNVRIGGVANGEE